MQSTQPIAQLLTRLWRHVSPRRRRQFGLLLILMLLASFAEIFSIGAVLPFLAVLTAPERIFEHPAMQPILQLFNLMTPEQLLLPVVIIFSVAALVAGAMRLVLLWSGTKLSFSIGADLSISIYRRTLYQPYEIHVARNSSEIISGISSRVNGVIGGVITPSMTLINAGVMLCMVLAAILFFEPVIALAALCGFGLIYGFIIWITRTRKAMNSLNVMRESTQVIKCLQEGLGGIRDVLIDGSQEAYCQIYGNADLLLRRAQGSNQFIGQSPRHGMEALGMVLIAALAYTFTQQADGIARVIPILGGLALSAQRLLPVMQQTYAAWSSIQGCHASLQNVLDLLDQPLPEYAGKPADKPLPFRQFIKLNQIFFRYSQQTPVVLNNFNLMIAKGDRVGFIGTTGGGKSTMLDIIMGLLQPTEGTLEIDGCTITTSNRRAWQAHIAHVPQAIFLADSTIEENIAFGVPKNQIDCERVRQVARQAQISDIIETWPKQYQTFVGERGIRLSGGQRQRIGIARALYKQADVIIFDEATSALDNETEQAVMHAIDGLSAELTILIVAHRLTTLKNCTQIVELDNGGVLRSGSYQSLITKPMPTK